LSREKKRLQSHIKNLQEHVSAVEEQLEQKQGQCEMVNSQLKDKEQRLKEALEYISALKEVMRIEDGRHSSALKKACSDHDSVKKELESCTNECIGYLNQLLEVVGSKFYDHKINFI
jgi:chromosome segregation ATPase